MNTIFIVSQESSFDMGLKVGKDPLDESNKTMTYNLIESCIAKGDRVIVLTSETSFVNDSFFTEMNECDKQYLNVLFDYITLKNDQVSRKRIAVAMRTLSCKGFNVFANIEFSSECSNITPFILSVREYCKSFHLKYIKKEGKSLNLRSAQSMLYVMMVMKDVKFYLSDSFVEELDSIKDFPKHFMTYENNIFKNIK